MKTERRRISPERQALYYLGMVLMAIGFICFFSVFFADTSHDIDGGRSLFTRAMVGMVITIVGGLLRGIGGSGLAGSGLKLDPEEARRDVEPWSRMTGGVVKDVLDEAGIQLGAQQAARDALPFDERLRRLEKLREDGLVSEEEYERVRKRILDGA